VYYFVIVISCVSEQVIISTLLLIKINVPEYKKVKKSFMIPIYMYYMIDTLNNLTLKLATLISQAHILIWNSHCFFLPQGEASYT